MDLSTRSYDNSIAFAPLRLNHSTTYMSIYSYIYTYIHIYFKLEYILQARITLSNIYVHKLIAITTYYRNISCLKSRANNENIEVIATLTQLQYHLCTNQELIKDFYNNVKTWKFANYINTFTSSFLLKMHHKLFSSRNRKLCFRLGRVYVFSTAATCYILYILNIR